MMHNLSDNGGVKPNKIEVDDKYKGKKNVDYHSDFARYFIVMSQTSDYTDFILRTKLNKNFYKGKQWELSEDVEGFLKDASGGTNSRIKIIHNLIRPMVEQYRGNAHRMNINVSAKSVSKRAIDRKDQALQEKLLMTDLANEFPALGDSIREKSGVGRTESETTEIFENYYVDKYQTEITNLVRYVKNLNELEKLQPEVALNLCLSGIAVLEAFEHGGHLRYRLVESEDYIFDPTCKRIDHSDAEFKGLVNYMHSSEIYEMYQNMKVEDRNAIEKYLSGLGQESYTNASERKSDGRIPVYKVYWKDTAKYEYAYVKDDFDYPYLTRINFKEEWEEEFKYTDKDIIDPPNTAKNKRLFKNGNKKRSMYVDQLRYCYMIPGEAITSNREGGGNTEKNQDIVLEYGVYEHQETEMMDLKNVKFPIKTHCWAYVDGEILSPVDDAINPQRFINRILSVAESQINSSGGAGIVYDKDLVDDQEDELQILSDVKAGNPVGIATRGKGITNAVGSYDATPKKGTYDLLNIIPVMKGLIQDTSGVNEGLKGESTGSDQLVGVTQLLIQRGSLMQEPFYAALNNAFGQLHSFCATVGKRMYIDNERELVFSVGDEGAKVITLSKDMRNEDFRIFITRDNSDEMQTQQGNQLLTAFLEYQMIDEKFFADNYDRSTPSEVVMNLRKHVNQKIEAQKEMQEAQQQDAAAAAGQEQQAMEFAGMQEEMQGNKKHKQKLDEIAAQGAVQGMNAQMSSQGAQQ